MGVVLSASAHRLVLDRARLDASLSRPHKDFKVDIPALAKSLEGRGLDHDESSLGVRLSKSGPFMAVVRQIEPIVALEAPAKEQQAASVSNRIAMLHPSNVEVAPLFLSDLAWCNGSAVLKCVFESIRTHGADVDLERKMAGLVDAERKIPYHRKTRAKMSAKEVSAATASPAEPVAGPLKPTPSSSSSSTAAKREPSASSSSSAKRAPSSSSSSATKPASKQTTLSFAGGKGGVPAPSPAPSTKSRLADVLAKAKQDKEQKVAADKWRVDSQAKRLTDAIDFLGLGSGLSKLADGTYNLLPAAVGADSFDKIMTVMRARVKRTSEVCDWRHQTDPYMSAETHYMALAASRSSDDVLRGTRFVLTPRAPNALSFGHIRSHSTRIRHA